MYQIYIRDSNYKRIGEITEFTKLELIPRFNAVGSFVLDIPTDTMAAKELIKPKYGIIVKRDGKTLFSGTVTGRHRSFTVKGDTLTIIGKDDMKVLAETLALPDPNGDLNSQAYDVRTGKASTIMMEYVDYNCGPKALPERRKIVLGNDVGLGNIVQGRARFHNLIEFLSSLALKGGGLGFNVVQGENGLEFDVYQLEDKTKAAFFSPLLGNLASFEYSQNNPEANFIVVGGGGEGKERILLTKNDNSSIAKFGRIETFVDRRDTTEVDELHQSLDEELINKAEQNAFLFTPIDTPQLSFGRDYNLGDKVSVVLTMPNEVVDIETIYYFISAYQAVPVDVERLRKVQEKFEVIQDIVREVKITIDSNGETIIPVVGTEESNKSNILGIFDKQRKLEKRINNLERR
ncbi:siphovirus ReqiPepy6 Gp37-like family protein [Bacillus sp. 1P02SD]|uniref:siphovirus ReqiPepy6 Gp37-like family protein n=1 Tax=Bacillus sp. 1P02SD TaxID=3132264 RepID=UPI0039A331D1